MQNELTRQNALLPSADARAARAPRHIQVSAAAPAGVAPLDMGDPEGSHPRIRLTTRYVEVDGVPWIPVMGEYHFSRDLPERWETELRKMKAGGINVLATYVLWILHEEVEGKIRWDGHRDLRRFVQLADRVGLKVVIRIGPWAHGETRNGGFPDWLQALPIAHRTNDPVYLDHARRWYASIEEQVRGLFHSSSNPAGPIIGIQVENELYDQRDHIGTLRDIAESLGLRASLWTATGWGGAELPAGRVLPVYAGYSDGFWEESDTQWPAFGKMHFTYNTVRDDLTVGADLRVAPVDVSEDATLGADDPWPYATCELGGGMAVAYHRRPRVDSDDVAALALTKLGSGSAWQGYYMYHGGSHVIGELSTTQESHATGYPNDVPVRDYDFFAPLGAAGEERPHFHKLRQQHLMIASFGDALAPATTTIPDSRDGDPRWAVRSDGNRGFLFVNNHQPAIAALPAIEDLQFAVEFETDAVRIPSRAFTLDAGAYFVWPLRQALGDIPSLSVTAQPISQLTTSEGTVVLFGAIEGVDLELQFEGVAPHQVSGATVVARGHSLIATPLERPGMACEVRVGTTTLVFLDPRTAESVWRGEVNGQEALLVWDGNAWFDDGFVIEVPDSDRALYTYPALQGMPAASGEDEGTVFTRYTVPGEGVTVSLDVPRIPQIGTAPIRSSGTARRLSAPTDSDFAGLTPIDLPIPTSALVPADRLLLRLDWIGDAMRLYVGDRLITDQFWSGRPLEVDIAPYRLELASQPLTLKAFAWDPDSAVYVDPRVRPTAQEPIFEIRSATITPVQLQRLT